MAKDIIINQLPPPSAPTTVEVDDFGEFGFYGISNDYSPPVSKTPLIDLTRFTRIFYNEILQEGDEYYSPYLDKWIPTNMIGRPNQDKEGYYRRSYYRAPISSKTQEETKNSIDELFEREAKLIDTKLYRRVRKDEKLEASDEYYERKSREWHKTLFTNTCPTLHVYRRKLKNG